MSEEKKSVVSTPALPTDVAGRLIACNLVESTKECRRGALVYVTDDNPGNGRERVKVFARSRSGRWIRKWVRLEQLQNFRFKTVSAESSLAGREPVREGMALAARYWNRDGAEAASGFEQQAAARRQERSDAGG